MCWSFQICFVRQQGDQAGAVQLPKNTCYCFRQLNGKSGNRGRAGLPPRILCNRLGVGPPLFAGELGKHLQQDLRPVLAVALGLGHAVDLFR